MIRTNNDVDDIFDIPDEPYADAEYIMGKLSCGRSKAYMIIKELNDELEAKGKKVFKGKVSRRYLKERLYI